jgi:geranylgeranyl pyrophosphate synthase
VSANAAAVQLAEVLDRGGARLRGLLDATEHRLAEVAEGYGDTLPAYAAETLAAGGKRLRPILVFITAGEAEGADLVDAGAAVELLHMATLVHDDVLDRAELRRGRRTVYASGGRGAATATGDLLFSRAFALLAATGSAEAVRALSDASSALARGELMQREDAWDVTVSRQRYLERCRLKTARLFEAACRLGAVLGDPGAAAEDRLAAFGERIGLAFQLFDDVLDVSGPSERTGKRRGADLLDGTVTLPLILARERDPALAGLELREGSLDPAGAEALCDRIAATGALDDTRAEAAGHVAAAKGLLSELDLSDSQRELLDLVADGVVERYA